MQSLTLTPSDLPVTWQGISEVTTQRGRVKPVLTGIPGPLFWHHWKHRQEFRAQLRAAMVTLRKLESAQWEVVLWINRHNQTAVENLGFRVPDLAAKPAGEPAPF